MQAPSNHCSWYFIQILCVLKHSTLMCAGLVRTCVRFEEKNVEAMKNGTRKEVFI